jgi:tetratricopeptide (TPR) repeat protein
MMLRTSLVLSLSLSLLSPLTVQAQSNPKQEEREKAKEAFKRAEAHYKTGDYEKALEGYKESYLLSQEPILLYNMAQCHRLLGRSEEALRVYKNFVKDSPSNTKFVKEANKFIKDLEEVVKKQKEIEKANPTTVAPATEPANKNNNPIVTTPPEDQPKSQPGEVRPAPAAKRPPPFMLAATGSAALAMGLGAFSLSRTSQANELAEVGDFEASANILRGARITGLASDVLLGVSLVNAGLACVLSEDEGTGRLMTMGGVGGAAVAIVLGGASLQTAQRAKELADAGDFEASAQKLSVARGLGTTTAVVGGLSLVGAGAGLSMWKVEGEATPVPKYVALGSTVGALVAGGASLSLANQSKQQADAGDFEASAKTIQSARMIGLTADVLGVTAVASAAAGALLARKADTKNVSVAPSIGGAAISVSF